MDQDRQHGQVFVLEKRFGGNNGRKRDFLVFLKLS